MAGKLLKETKDTQPKKRRAKKDIEEDNVYKMNFDNENNNIIKVVDDDDEIDDIFGNVNKWLTEENLEENFKKIREQEKEKKARKRRLTKIEDGIKSSKNSVAKRTKTAQINLEKEIEENEANKDIEDEEIEKIEEVKAKTKTKTTRTKNKRTTTKKKVEELQGEIKINAENDTTEVLLAHNNYRIELQKLEYNI